MEETLKKAKGIITEEVEKAGCRVCRVLLFGSRAKGTAHPDSDWDFYVIVDRDLDFHEMQEIATRIRWGFARAGFYADVFLQSERVVQERAHNTGYLTYYALKEGVEI